MTPPLAPDRGRARVGSRARPPSFPPRTSPRCSTWNITSPLAGSRCSTWNMAGHEAAHKSLFSRMLHVELGLQKADPAHRHILRARTFLRRLGRTVRVENAELRDIDSEPGRTSTSEPAPCASQAANRATRLPTRRHETWCARVENLWASRDRGDVPRGTSSGKTLSSAFVRGPAGRRDARAPPDRSSRAGSSPCSPSRSSAERGPRAPRAAEPPSRSPRAPP